MVLITAMTLVAEKIPGGQGLGFDGVYFARLAIDFDKVLDGSWKLAITGYNRFLPSLLCRLTLKGLGLDLTPPNIIVFFESYNVLLLTLAGFFWGLLSDLEEFSWRGRWLGFMALFFSHAVLKYGLYYPVLTDLSALTLGMVMLWAYRRGLGLVLLSATAAGAMTWPTLLLQGLLLWIFPYRLGTEQTKNRHHPAPWASACLTFVLLGYLIYAFFNRGEYPLQGSLYPLAGAAIEATYVGLAVFFLFDDKMFFSLTTLRSRISPLRLVLAVAAVGAAPLLLWKLTGFRIDYRVQGMAYLFQAVRLGMKYPGEFIVAHILYFGPWLLLLVRFYPEAARQARKGGPGLPLLSLMTIVQSLTPLSRQLIAAMPVFVFLTAAAVDRAPRLGKHFLPWFGLLSLFFSKAWMRFSLDAARPANTFSFDWYVSSTGCWMAFPFYFWQGLAVVVVAAGLFWMLRRCGTIKNNAVRSIL